MGLVDFVVSLVFAFIGYVVGVRATKWTIERDTITRPISRTIASSRQDDSIIVSSSQGGEDPYGANDIPRWGLRLALLTTSLKA